ncbi:sodium-independent sulfate anion transporter isoform X1 [Phyllopteryx taeniolatus]|uniref:sodium-independent sulfate anion transporter isoform X1 n=1 Tax=Phyllopteryx taeniolatus TaxID=161469 RepID=UPI002AD3621C|nr:sodium-independent sulfate anion transporter isoform X1 [Phyllopteryx taeniolatus]
MDQPLLQRDSGPGCCSCRMLKAWLPILSWLPKYTLKWLQMDLLAGLTVGLTTVPQALAYAEVAGLPVQYGLYSAFMGGFIYTFLGTSKDVTLGPTAIMSLLCFSLVGGEPRRAVLLSLLCGLIQAALALLRLGFLLDFISFPVIKGFTCAAAITIGFGQVKNILGLQDIPHEFFPQVYYTFYKIPEAQIGDVVLGLLCVALLVMLMSMKTSLGSGDDAPTFSRVARRFVWAVATMRNALIVVAASFCAFSWEAYGHHVFTITGETSQGLPPFRPPPTSDTTANGTVVTFGEIVEDFGGGLAVIPFMGLLESIAIAKAFGDLDKVKDPREHQPQSKSIIHSGCSKNTSELLFYTFAEQLQNRCQPGTVGNWCDQHHGLLCLSLPCHWQLWKVVCVCVCEREREREKDQCTVFTDSCFVAMFRTAVNSQTGVCTPAGGIVTSVIVLLSLAFLMPAFYYIPKASLAAVIICAVAPMVDYQVVAKMWQIHKLDLLPFTVTFLMSFWEVQYGIIGGVALSGALLMYTMARPQIKMSHQGVLLIQLASGLSFPAAEHLSHIIHTQALQESPPHSVVLDCHHVSVIDYTVINELSDLLRQFKRQDVCLILSGVQPNVLEILLAADLEGLRYADGVETALQMGSGNLNL